MRKCGLRIEGFVTHLCDTNPMPETTAPALISVPELARMLGVSVGTAYAAIKSGQWPVVTVRVGAQIRVTRVSVKRWLEGETSDA